MNVCCRYPNWNFLEDLISRDSVMDEKSLPHLFERFYRVDKGRSRSKGGTGLGLAICRTIATQLGGEAKLDLTHQGRGARFIFTHPV